MFSSPGDTHLLENSFVKSVKSEYDEENVGSNLILFPPENEIKKLKSKFLYLKLLAKPPVTVGKVGPS